MEGDEDGDLGLSLALVDLGFLIGDACGGVWEGDDMEDEEERKSSALEGLAEGLTKYDDLILLIFLIFLLF